VDGRGTPPRLEEISHPGTEAPKLSKKKSYGGEGVARGGSTSPQD